MTKRIKLSERDKKGRIYKNESFTFDELRDYVLRRDYRYFHHWWYGPSRIKTLDRILGDFSAIIDLDMPGNFTLEK